MANTPNRMDPWQAKPLCCHHVSAHFDDQPVQILADDGSSHELTVTWALGALHDGDWEVLGAWPVSATGPAFLRGMLDEFTARGVEKRISFVLADPIADVQVAGTGRKVLPPFRRILCRRDASLASRAGALNAGARRTVREASGARTARAALERLRSRLGTTGMAAVFAADWLDVLPQFEVFYALPPRRRVVVRRGDEAAEVLGRSLSRAVGRHGAFPDPAAATSFVAETLAHAERRLKASAFVGPDISAHRAAPSVSALGSGLAGRGI